MTEIRFTWDENKNISNQRKHDGIAFEVAAQVFRDPLRLTRQDRVEGYVMRWQTIGWFSLWRHGLAGGSYDRGGRLGRDIDRDHQDHFGAKSNQIGKETL